MSATHAVKKDRLTEAEAKARADSVAFVSYRIFLDIRGHDGYSGETTIRFRATNRDADTFLDFRFRRILRATLNGRALTGIDAEGCRITLPRELLADWNEVVVRYENAYDKGGVGLHRFEDPEDGAAYLYTDFEPFNAHRLFPAFDQPDLKAVYDLEVIAPDDWVVIGNGRETRWDREDSGGVRRRFSAPFSFSTYLFAMIAGPYHSVRRTIDGVDMGLYCRRSLAKWLDADDLFTITAQGFDFYADHFAQKYPFGKYDQIFVPEYNSGAMENVAAVTFNEAYLFRDPPTETQLLGRAEVVLHELAHMWFGNLVTMRWWKDLWLNESFATYASYLAMSKATRFTHCFDNFRGQIKAWALREDQKPTTHPIACEVDDTDQTFLNFDGITYGKGASVLKQLSAYLGEDVFRDGLRIYFARHAWKNTEVEDFLGALSEAAQKDLGPWAEKWLKKSGVNVVRPCVSWHGRSIEAVSLKQEKGNGDQVLRPHTLDVGVYAERGDRVERIALTRASLSGEGADVPGIRGVADALFVWANDDDHGYARVFLDDPSLDGALRNFVKIDDALTRQSILGAVWEMVRDGVLSVPRYLEWARGVIAGEEKQDVLETAMRTAAQALGRYLSPDAIEAETQKTFAAVVAAARAAEAGSDRAVAIARTAPSFVLTRAAAEELLTWLDGNGPANAAEDQGLRWRVLVRASAFDLPNAAALIDAELKRDPSDRGGKSAYTARVSAPDPQQKAAAFAEFVHAGGLSADMKKSGMAGFFWGHQEEILRPFAARYFDEVQAVIATHDLEYATRGFARLLYPHALTEMTTLERGERLLAALRPEEAPLRRILLEENDELARALRLRTGKGSDSLPGGEERRSTRGRRS